MQDTIKLFTSVVIVAGGRGTRMNMDKNKQYIDILGKPVLARTIEKFDKCSSVNEVILVVNEQDISYCKENIIEAYGFAKVKEVVAGGSERQHSVSNGLLAVSKNTDIVLIHDGARPFVIEKNIIDSIHSANEFGACVIAVPVKDTIKVSGEDGFVKETPDRNSLWSVQTPQAFKYDIIMKAHHKAINEGYTGTDDAVLVEKLGIKIKLAMGSYDNIKITTREDLVVAQAIAGDGDLK